MTTVKNIPGWNRYLPRRIFISRGARIVDRIDTLLQDLTGRLITEENILIFKGIILFLLLIVIASLANAAIVMSKGEDTDGKLLRSLTIRISLSVFIFILLLVGQAIGLITPHGL